jgi:O-antigen ligase
MCNRYKPAIKWSSVLFSALSLILFYLIPFTIPRLNASPHVFFVIVALLLFVTWQALSLPRSDIARLFVVYTTVLLIILYLFFTEQFDGSDPLRALIISLATFWLIRSTFNYFPQRCLDRTAELLLFCWALAGIAQAFYGAAAYPSYWFGVPPNVIYSTGLSSFSNHAAILIVPLLVWVLTINITYPKWWRTALWAGGCLALYFTLSRAGWLAIGISVLVVALRVSKNVTQLRRTLFHILIGLGAACLAWLATTRVDAYEPGGVRSAGRWELRAESTSSGQDYSRATRWVTARVAMDAARQSPLSGIGLGRFPDYYEANHSKYLKQAAIDPRARMTPHNGYLQLLAEAGIPATFIFLFVVLITAFRLSRCSNQISISIQASLFGVMGWLIFHDGFYDRHFWILLGAGFAALDFRHPPDVATT